MPSFQMTRPSLVQRKPCPREQEAQFPRGLPSSRPFVSPLTWAASLSLGGLFPPTVTLTAPQAGSCITLSHCSSLKIGANTSASRWNSPSPSFLYFPSSSLRLNPPLTPNPPSPVRQTPYGRTLCNVKSLQSGQPVLGEISYVTWNKEPGSGTCPH